MQVDQFAQAVQKTTDPEKLADAFYEAVRKQALDISKTHGAQSPEFVALEREARLWSLVQTVRAAQLDEPAVRHSKVLQWLMEMQIVPKEPEELTATKWLHTTAQVRAQPPRAGAGTCALDPDAPVRQSAILAPDDVAADNIVFSYLFELLLAGQRDKAARVCAATNNWQLQALVESPITPLVAATCFAVSVTPHLGAAERAVYGFLAGDVQAPLPLCTSWEQRLIVMVNSLVLSQQFVVPTKLALPKCPYRNLSDVFTALDEKESGFLHRVMAAVISDKLGELAATIASEIRVVAEGSSPNVTADPDLVRIAVHLVLIAGKAVQEGDAEVIIDAYCGYLEMLEKWHWLPGYVRVLSRDALVRVYSRGLAQIGTAPARQLQLQLAQKFGLPIADCVRAAVDLIVAQNADVLTDDQAEMAPGTADQLVAAVEWLRDAQLWDDGAQVSASIMQSLLAQENIGVALQLCRTTSLAELSERAVNVPENIKTELRLYDVLVRALEACEACESTESTELAELAATTAQTAARELAKAPESRVVTALRTKYVPIVVLEALRVLLAAKMYEQALEFAVLVADEKLRLYTLFNDTGRLPELLQGLARAELKNW